MQPYPALIALPDDHPNAKRVENRKWATDWRGMLAIHAGVSRKLIRPHPDHPEHDISGPCIADMAFGAFVATAILDGCYTKQWHVSWGVALRRHPWLATHVHAEGPICWILREIHMLPKPIQHKGQQGLWEVPPEIAEQLKQERIKAGY